MTDPGTTLEDVIHLRTAELNPAERPVARTLFASNPMAGFDAVAGIVGRLGDATHRRISTLEHLRTGYTWDEQEFPQHPEERGP